MFGFVIGIACLFGLARVLRGGACYGGDCGPSECGPGRGWRGGRRRWGGSRSFLGGMFEWINARPSQKRVIQDAIEDVLDAGGKLREQVHASRRDVAEAFRSESFDETVMADLLTRHDEAIDQLRKTVVLGLAKVHANLDPQQREQIARWLSRGPGFGSPYRTAHI
jgi:Spy/CpxP family protein refolding chaperone